MYATGCSALVRPVNVDEDEEAVELVIVVCVMVVVVVVVVATPVAARTVFERFILISLNPLGVVVLFK